MYEKSFLGQKAASDKQAYPPLAKSGNIWALKTVGDLS